MKSLYRDVHDEHILPYKPTISFPDLGFSNEEGYKANVDKLGNLCLPESKLRSGSKIRCNKIRLKYINPRLFSTGNFNYTLR